MSSANEFKAEQAHQISRLDIPKIVKWLKWWASEENQKAIVMHNMEVDRLINEEDREAIKEEV